jgi:hypothetical protein
VNLALLEIQTTAQTKGDFHLVTFIEENFLRNQVITVKFEIFGG